jgi:hypothetical protein
MPIGASCTPGPGRALGLCIFIVPLDPRSRQRAYALAALYGGVRRRSRTGELAAALIRKAPEFVQALSTLVGREAAAGGDGLVSSRPSERLGAPASPTPIEIPPSHAAGVNSGACEHHTDELHELWGSVRTADGLSGMARVHSVRVSTSTRFEPCASLLKLGQATRMARRVEPPESRSRGGAGRSVAVPHEENSSPLEKGSWSLLRSPPSWGPVVWVVGSPQFRGLLMG